MDPFKSSEIETPIVSVVMCSFNPSADFFREAIESVCLQTYAKWELLIVDNGTTNGSDLVALEYASTKSNIYFFTHLNRENKGPAASRNLGIEKAGGEWIAFLDADDFWLPDKLTQQIEAMQSHPQAALSFGGILRWYNGDSGKNDEPEVHTEELEVLPPPLLIQRLLRNECIPGMSALMVRTDLAKEVGGFEENLRWAEDQTISYKLGLKQECLILPGWKVKYRQHSASTTTGVISNNRLFSDHLRFLDWIGEYFKASQVSDLGLLKQFRKLHRQYQWLVLKQKLIPNAIKSILKRLLKVS